MGGWFSHLWWGGDPDAVNSLSGLTRREVYAVQRSWAPVYVDSVANGTELLKRLFRAFPDTREFFKMLRKLPEHEYESNMQFKAHVINLMNSIDLAVGHMNQPDVVAAMMVKIGESHKKRKICEQQFLELKDVLMKMFIEVLKLDDITHGAWSKTIDFCLSIMGQLLSRWWWGGDPDDPSPVSGLTLRQVYQVQSTWEPVQKDAGKYGMELFLRLFRANAETKTFFKTIRDLDEDRIRNSYQFKAHTINFMSAINQAIANLRQPEVVVALMEKLGESHGNRRISTKHFHVTKDVLVDMLKNDLKLTDELLKAWDAFIIFIFRHIFDKL